jgi:hypothetical protein
MKYLLTLAALLFTLGTSQAEISASHRAAIEKLLLVSEVQKQIEASMGPALDGGLGVTEEQIKSMPEAQQVKMRAGIAKVKAFMLETLSWDKIKDEVIAAYAKTYSEQEATQVTQMLESEAGKLFLAKQIAVTPDMVKVTQDRMKAAVPQIMQIMQQEMQK